MPKILTLVLMLMLAGCSSMHATSSAKTDGASDVQVLSDYPKAKFKKLGFIMYEYHGSWIFSPNVEDAYPSLKAKVKTYGANAFIVRHYYESGSQTLVIYTEMLKIGK